MTALAVAAIPVLAGCDTSPDAAAVIGGDRISISDLQSQVNAALADPQIAGALAPGSQFASALGSNRPGFVRVTLSRMITHQLLGKLAAQHHVTVTNKEVSDQIANFVQQAGSLASLRQQAAEGVGVTAAQLPGLIRDTVLQKKLSDALVANLPVTQEQLQSEYQKDIDQYDQLDVAQIAVTSKTLAQKVLTKAQHAPGNFAALAKQYSQDTATSGSGGEVGFVGRSQVVSLVGSAAKAKVGSVVLAHTSGEWIVLHIISRKITPIAQATDQLKSAIFAAQAASLLSKAITAEESKLGVHVNPRYGHWDPKSQAVVASKSAISSTG